MSQETIQRIELSCYDQDIHCPFCGTYIFKEEIDEPCNANPCEHVLFVATDEGFEYRSKKFDQATGLNSDDYDPDLGDMNIDEFTDRTPVNEALKFAVHVPAPSFFGVYYGFAAD